MEHLTPTTIYVEVSGDHHSVFKPKWIQAVLHIYNKQNPKRAILEELPDRYVFTREELEALLRKEIEAAFKVAESCIGVRLNITSEDIDNRINALFSGTKQETK